MEDYNVNQKEQMHNILDRGFNNLRQSFDKCSSTNRSMSSSQQSPSVRKKSQLRRVLDDMKLSSSRIDTYTEEPHYNINDQTSSRIQHNMSMSSMGNQPHESPLRQGIKNKRAEMQNELSMLQQKIQGLEDKFAKNSRDSGNSFSLIINRQQVEHQKLR